MTPEERREIQRPLDLWDVEEREPRIPGPAAVIGVCILAAVSSLALAAAIWMIFRGFLSKP